MASIPMKTNAFLVTFLFHFFSNGNIILNGVLYKSIESSDGFSNKLAGLLFMLPYTTSRIFGPAVSVMMNYVSPKILVTFGSLLFGLGFCCSGLLPLRPVYIFPCFIVSGIGLACINLPSIWHLEKSFGVNFRSIMPLALLGTYAGLVVIPVIAAYCKAKYGTSAVLFLFGAVGWNIMPCGLLFPSSIPVTSSSDQQYTNTKARRSQHAHENNSQVHSMPDVNDRKILSKYVTSLIGAVLRMLVVLTDEVFLVFLIVANLRKIPNDVWNLFLIPRIQERGLSLQTAAAVSSIGGVGGIFGRLLAAVSFNTSVNASLILFCWFFILNGIVFIIVETLATFGYAWAIGLASFCNGLFLSAQSGMTAGVLHLLIKPEQYVGAYGLVELGTGIFTLLAGVVPGSLIDSSVGFQGIFIAIGLISILNGLLMLMATIMLYFKNRSKCRCLEMP